MFFSIIIPVYNSEKTLSKLLNSILEQNFNNYEIIIINDGSVDNTEDIILSYKSKFNHYKYIFKENSGVSSTRNIGLQNVEGKYILFADADDYFENDYLLNYIPILSITNRNCFALIIIMYSLIQGKLMD